MKRAGLYWHLWWRQHADLSKKIKLIDAASDFEVLYRLKGERTSLEAQGEAGGEF